MNLKKLGNNSTLVTLCNDTTILFSYSTPVAATINGKDYRTEKKWSVTTSKHISQAGYKNAEEKPQSFFDNLTS